MNDLISYYGMACHDCACERQSRIKLRKSLLLNYQLLLTTATPYLSPCLRLSLFSSHPVFLLFDIIDAARLDITLPHETTGPHFTFTCLFIQYYLLLHACYCSDFLIFPAKSEVRHRFHGLSFSFPTKQPKFLFSCTQAKRIHAFSCTFSISISFSYSCTSVGRAFHVIHFCKQASISYYHYKTSSTNILGESHEAQ